MRGLVIVLAVLTTVAAADGQSAAETAPAAAHHPPIAEHVCEAAQGVRVRQASAHETGLVCEGARRAMQFLHEAGLQWPDRLIIDVMDRLPGELDGRAVGCYVPETRHVRLLSYAAFVSAGPWLRVPADEELYRSVASHETAHAVVACHVDPARVPLAVHEYAAYIAMFATMDQGLRARVLSRFQGSGLENSLQINSLVYLVDPPQFAVDAWRHYSKRRDKAAWLRSLVAGEVVQETWGGESP